MANLMEYKCPCCGGIVEFDSTIQKMKCPYCDTEFTVEEMLGKDDVLQEQQPEPQPDPDLGGMGVYTCKSCGGELVADENTAATHCPFCGNPVTLTGRLSGGWKPDFVIPFQKTKEDAKQALRGFAEGKKLVPKQFTSESHLDEIKGVYVPFWLYDCTYSGRVYYEAYKDTAVREGDYIVTNRDYYDADRFIELSFKDIPVDGSSRLDDALMDSMEPFDYSDIKPFRMDYLSGFFAERFDKESDEVKQRAENRMMTSALGIVDSNANIGSGYTGMVNKGNDLVADPIHSRYVLLPVYTFDVTWGGKKYSFAMNGQTGKVVGDVPTDKKLSLIKRWGTFAAVFVIMMLLISFISC